MAEAIAKGEKSSASAEDLRPSVDLCRSYMTGRSQCVHWNDLKSGTKPLTHGVPQGSILGPLLFLMMIANLPTYVIGNMKKARIMSYADDCTIYVHAETLQILKINIEILANRMISFCKDTGLILNSEKTQLLVSSK